MDSFQTASLVGWRTFYIDLSFERGRARAQLVAPAKHVVLGHRGPYITPDLQPIEDEFDRHGLYFWAWRFRDHHVRPDADFGAHRDGTISVLVAARVRVPARHYAIISGNGVARASALRIEHIRMPAKLPHDVSERLHKIFTRYGITVARADADAPVIIYPSAFDVFLDDETLQVEPRGFWRRGWEYTNRWSELRQLLAEQEILT